MDLGTYLPTVFGDVKCPFCNHPSTGLPDFDRRRAEVLTMRVVISTFFLHVVPPVYMDVALAVQLRCQCLMHVHT